MVIGMLQLCFLQHYSRVSVFVTISIFVFELAYVCVQVVLQWCNGLSIEFIV